MYDILGLCIACMYMYWTHGSPCGFSIAILYPYSIGLREPFEHEAAHQLHSVESFQSQRHLRMFGNYLITAFLCHVVNEEGGSSIGVICHTATKKCRELQMNT